MYGMAPLAGLDGGGFMADLVLVPYADAMLLPIPEAVDPVAIASLSDNIPDGWRAVGPYRAELAALDPVDRRVLVVGRLSIGLYAAAFASAFGAQVDYVDTDPQRLAAAEKLGAARARPAKPDKSWDPYPITVHTSADPRCSPRRCAPRGRTACAPIPASTTRARSRCRCCRCTPAACGSSPDGSTPGP